MSSRRVVVAGGGAAGIFAAITCAAEAPATEVMVFEKGPRFLSKVRISGGGRCNVTHACFEPKELARYYPRGAQELIGPFSRFHCGDTINWFRSHGVELKTERDGRIFPTTDSSSTIIDCLLEEAKRRGVQLATNLGVAAASNESNGSFQLTLSNGTMVVCDCLLLATGGCRTAALGQLAGSLGHILEPPVPSLFTFHVETEWVRALAGVSADPVEVSVPGRSLRAQGAVLLTHWGLSGPAILRLSAWGARELHQFDYRFPLQINWLPERSLEAISAELSSRRDSQPARLIVNTPLSPLSARLWEKLVLAAGVGPETRWAALSRSAHHRLLEQLMRTHLPVIGKSLNKDEFVTCGGVRLSEVNFKTMESRKCPGLYFAGELLDIDGLTGGFNFQAAWTTGWLAGRAMAQLAKS